MKLFRIYNGKIRGCAVHRIVVAHDPESAMRLFFMATGYIVSDDHVKELGDIPGEFVEEEDFEG